MDLLKTILDSNALSVLLGGFVSLGSVYFVEFLNLKREKLRKKEKFSHELIAVANKIYYYAILDAQVDTMFAYHKRVNEISIDEFHKTEGVRRMLQLEEIKLKRIDLIVQLTTLGVQTSSHFDDNSALREIIREIENYELPNETYYDDVNNMHGLNIKFKTDDNSKTNQINTTLKIKVEALTTYLTF